jgi:6-phosphogluconolactonase
MIRQFNDQESLSRGAADLFVQQARRAVQDREKFLVALAGGQTPRRTYELLALPPRLEQTPWTKTHIFWGDERCVPDDDERNNARMTRLALLDRVPAESAHVHPIRCAGAPEEAANQYEALLRSTLSAANPCLDLVFLGLGEDGHTASLFPFNTVLEEKDRWAAAVSTAGQKIRRVTLMPSVLTAARMVVFLVSGHSKAAILKTVLEGPVEPHRLPAQLMFSACERTIWMVDREAASLLDAQTLTADANSRFSCSGS